VLRALSVELSKATRQRLGLAALGCLAVLVGLFAWGMWAHPLPQRLPGTAAGEFVVGGRLSTAPLLCYLLLRVPVATTLLLPLLLAVFTGGLLAGERHLGTLRTLLARPVTRAGLLGAKLLTSWIYALALCAFLGLFSLLLGYLLFGPGDLVPMFGQGHGLTIFDHRQALGRLALGYGLAAAALTAVASLGLFFSSLCDNPLTAAGLTVAFLFISAALQVLPYFESWKPYLLTSYLDLGNHAFAKRIPWAEIGTGLAYLGGYSALAALLAGVVLWRRDVLC
jgi:ABC-2 type transport system permease protein